MALLDTNMLIDLSKRGRSDASHRAQARLADLVHRGEDVYTSRINEAEFRVGPHRMVNPAGELLAVEEVLSSCLMLEFDAPAALRFAEAKAHLLDIGRPIGDADTQIAAVAQANGQTLVTRNLKHFADVPGLVTETY